MQLSVFEVLLKTVHQTIHNSLKFHLKGKYGISHCLFR